MGFVGRCHNCDAYTHRHSRVKPGVQSLAKGMRSIALRLSPSPASSSGHLPRSLMPRSRSILLGSFLALLSVLCPSTAPAQASPPSRPFLWRIEGAGKTAYLFGTIHLSGPRETKLAPSVEAAVTGSDALYCEVPMDMGSQMKAATGLLSGGKSLRETLPGELYDRAEKELKRINPALDLKPFDRMQVWALAMTLALLEEQIKNAGAQPLDALLYSRAEAAGKQVGGIETIDEQLGVFSKFSEADQLEMLRSTIDDIEKARKEGKSPIEDLRNSYLTGDLAQLDREMQKWMEALSEGFRKRVTALLFTERNHHMAERMAAKLKEAPGKGFFFAVGAGHLGGAEGVLALLEKTGLKVSRVE